ncbi:hypothetical protein F1559_004502 [Cyanidiococcus yangmingshanensis]|uniref:Uncharacterized protein n=1 Tax=Cyanidiococcus yangmingshanensis TaxID=2690220 RepID=A0A7J7IN84_9RHOD|nr:hypothetical protein F1559_004502 [Cyanidiococcus yangmingshanensis]
MSSAEGSKSVSAEPLEWLETLLDKVLGEELGLEAPADNGGRAHALSTCHNVSVWRRLVPAALQRIAESAQLVATTSAAQQHLATATELHALNEYRCRQSQVNQVQHLLQDAVQQLYLADSFAPPSERLVQQVRALSKRLPGLDLYTDQNEQGLVLTLSSTTILIDVVVATGQVHVRYVNEHGAELDDPYAERDICDCLARGDIEGLTSRLQVLLQLEQLANEPTLQAHVHPRSCLIHWNDALSAKVTSAATVTLVEFEQCSPPLAFVRLTDGLSFIYDVQPLAYFVPEWSEATLEQVWHARVVRKAFLRLEEVVEEQGDSTATRLRPVLHLAEAMPLTASDWSRVRPLEAKESKRAAKGGRATNNAMVDAPSATLWSLVCHRWQRSTTDTERKGFVEKGFNKAVRHATSSDASQPSLSSMLERQVLVHQARLPPCISGESAPALWIQRIPLRDPEEVFRIAAVLRSRCILLDLMKSLLPHIIHPATDEPNENASAHGSMVQETAVEPSALLSSTVLQSVKETQSVVLMPKTASSCWKVHQHDLDGASVLILEQDGARGPSSGSEELAETVHAPAEHPRAFNESFSDYKRIEIELSNEGRIQVRTDGIENCLLATMLQTSRDLVASLAALETSRLGSQSGE